MNITRGEISPGKYSELRKYHDRNFRVAKFAGCENYTRQKLPRGENSAQQIFRLRNYLESFSLYRSIPRKLNTGDNISLFLQDNGCVRRKY